MPSSATDFASALEVAEQAFGALSLRSKKFLPLILLVCYSLFPMGKITSRNTNALKTLTDAQVSIYTLRIGTNAGTTIPLYEAGTGEVVGYKRDRQGKVVTTALQREASNKWPHKAAEAIIRLIAVIGIDAFLARVDELEQGEFSSQEYADFKDQYQWLAALGLCYYCLNGLYPCFS